MDRIKILWVSLFLPVSTAATAGSRTFTYYFNHFLEDERFDIRLIACGKPSDRDAAESELADVCHKIIYWPDSKVGRLKRIVNLESKYNPFHRYCGLISNYDRKQIVRTALDWKSRDYSPDMIILEWTSVVVLASAIKKIFPEAKLAACEHDVTFVGFQRKLEYYTGVRKWIWKIRYLREKDLELNSLRLCSLILPHNMDNIDLLKSEGIPKIRQQWLVPFYNDMTRLIRRHINNDILFYGAMARPENYLSAIWFIDHVMPLLESECVRFVIVGSNPPPALKKYETKRVHITGFVESVEPYFESSLCFVAPLILGAGIKVKVIEALSSGIPVLTNDIGIEGIHVKNNQEYYHCEKPEEYAEKIRQIIEQKEGCEVGMAAKKFIDNHYSMISSANNYKNRIVSMMEDN